MVNVAPWSLCSPDFLSQDKGAYSLTPSGLAMIWLLMEFSSADDYM